MNKTKLFLSTAVAAFIMAFTVSSYAQWTLTQTFPSLVGANPTISVYSPTGVVVFGGPSGLPTASRTTDGGVTWTNISGNMTGPELFCGWAVDANLMFGGDGGANGGAGGNARVWKTTNGGTNWTVIISTGGSGGFFNWILFSRITPTFGVAQSDPPAGVGTTYYLSKTTDGGATWNPFSPQPPGVSGAATAVNGGEVIDPLFIAMGLNAGAARVDITNNGGTSWFLGTLVGAGTGGFISAVCFSSDKLRGMAGTSGISTTISRTVNGGTTWASQSYGGGPGGYSTLKWITGTNIVYLMGSTGAGGPVKRSSDGGLTWTQMTTTPPGLTGFTHMEYFKAPNNAIYLYAVAPDGSVIYYADLSLVGIDPNNNNVPAEYQLEQNYPNPFNPTTTLKYALPKGSNVTLKVYDMLGNEIMTVVNGYQTAGNYVESIDASSLASGVYFYKLNAGDFTDSKKMTVVK